jgi:hypothetical protein
MTKKSLKAIALATALATAGSAYAQIVKPSDSFDYASHRNVPAIDGRSYEGVIFNYTLLLNGKISQTDKPSVNIIPRWFYDIDNDGKFGKAEEDAIKKGIPIYMHEEFNKTANAKVSEFLNAAEEYQKLYETLSKTTVSKDEVAKYQAKVEALEEKLRESGRACGLEDKALTSNLTLTPKLPAPEKEYSDGFQSKEVPKYDPLGQALWEDMNRKPCAKQEFPVYEQPKSEPKPVEQPKYTPKPVKEKSVKEKTQSSWNLSLNAGANSNFKDNVELNAGVRLNNGIFGIGVGADVGFENDKQLDSYSEKLASGRNFYGEVNEKDIFSVGWNGEIKVGPVFVGGGMGKRNSIEETIEKILKDGEVLKSNTNSTRESKPYWKAYGGLEIPLSKRLAVDGFGGYNSTTGAFGGAKLNIKLGK